MTITFSIVAVGMTLVALLLIATPLCQRLRAQQRTGEIRRELQTLDAANAAGTMSPEQYAAARYALGEALLDYIVIEPKHSALRLYSALVVALLVPFAAYGFYQWRVNPPALQTQASMSGSAAPLVNHGSDMQVSIAKLAAKLCEHPDDAEGWALLGRTHRATEHYPEARDAFKHAVAAAPGDADFEREYEAAETPIADNRVEPEQCLTLGNDEDETCLAIPVPTTNSATITVNVSLDPKLKGKVRPSDALFVFAKAAQGSAMPLAIARLTAAQLPASVKLNDSMSMMPNLTISKFEQIVRGARISKSGNAAPQKSDYQTVFSTLANSSVQPINLIIDHAVE